MNRQLNAQRLLANVAGSTAGLFLLAGCTHTTSGSNNSGQDPVAITDGMVAAAHPLAAEAGAEVLRSGGNAMDAAVATALALGVVEPYASGLGGGGFLVYYDAATKETKVYDYREVAPSGLKDDHLKEDGEWEGRTLRSGGLAVAVPGTLRGLQRAHQDHGVLEWGQLVQPAIRHAAEGFPITETMAATIAERQDLILEDMATSDIYLQDGLFALEAGTELKQPALAETLRRVAANGDQAIYGPEAAGHIAKTVQATGGVMTAEDLAAYEPRLREPLRGQYRGYEILTTSPPSAGGIQLIQALSLLNEYDVTSMGNMSAEYLATLALILEQVEQTSDANIGDPAFSEIPMDFLLSEQWKAQALGKIQASGFDASAGEMAVARPLSMIPYRFEEPGNTTHLSVIDRDGNIAALTQTINYFFGAGVTVPELGVLLNNEMYDFSVEEGSPNFPEPRKIPRSSIAPMIVLKDGQPVATLGTPGGRRIPGALVQILVQKIDFGVSLQEAIDAPRIYVDSGRKRLNYESRIPEETISAIGALLAPTGDWEFQKKADFDRYFGGAQAIWLEIDPGQRAHPEGAADPRRDGVAVAEGFVAAGQ